MRVRHLHTFVQNQRLLITGRTESLRGYNLGVDAAAWARGLLELKDPFAEVMGGLPLRSGSAIDKQLERFQGYEITPYFFFQGLSPSGHSLFTKIDSRAISEAWSLVLNNNLTHAHAKMGRIASRLTDELICFLGRHLRTRAFCVDQSSMDKSTAEAATPPSSSSNRTIRLKRRLIVFPCPYLTGSQINYFVRTKMLDAVFGLTSFLLIGLPRVITGLDFDRGKFEWAERDALLQAWDVTEHQLGDACIIAGTDYCHTLPHVNILSPKAFSFEVAVNLSKAGTLQQYLQVQSRNVLPTGFSQLFPDVRIRKEFRHLYCLSRSLLVVSVAMQGLGHVLSVSGSEASSTGLKEPLASDLDPVASANLVQSLEHKSATGTIVSGVPHDLRLVNGWRLPDAVFVLVLQGLISPTLPKVLAYGEWRDLDSPIVMPSVYEDALFQCRPYRLIALGLIARLLHPSYLRRRIVFEYVSRHCDDPLVLLANAKDAATTSQYCPNLKPPLPWLFTIKDVENQLQARNLNAASIHFCLDWHISSMRPAFPDDYAAIPIECCYPTCPLIGNDRPRYIDLGPVDVCRIEQTARRHLALKSKRKRLFPAQNYVLTLIIMTFLDCIDYFDPTSSPMGGPTALGLLFRNHCQSDFESEMMVAIELMKQGHLNGQEYHYSPENEYPVELTNPSPAPYAELAAKFVATVPRKWQMRFHPNVTLDANQCQRSCRLICRVASLVPITLDPEVKGCPGQYLDFDIAAFQSIVKNVRRSLNYIVEGCIASLALEKPAYARVLTPDLFDPNDTRILWFKPALGIGGVMMRSILLGTARSPEAAQSFAASLPQKYCEVPKFWDTIFMLCDFWAQISKIIRGLNDPVKETENLAAEFACADTLLCLQIWDLLPYSNANDILQSFPSFCELVESTLGVDLAAGMAKRLSRSGMPSSEGM